MQAAAYPPPESDAGGSKSHAREWVRPQHIPRLGVMWGPACQTADVAAFLLQDIPLLQQLLFSGSQKHNQERIFMLRLLAGGFRSGFFCASTCPAMHGDLSPRAEPVS